MPLPRAPFAALLLPAALLAQAPPSLPRQAERLYLNLRKEGLVSFEADVTPDWEFMLGAKAAENPEALRALRGLRFRVVLDEKGSVRVTHFADIPAATPQAEQGYQQIFGGMEQLMDGFFATWALFMLNTPFPGEGVAFQTTTAGGLTHLAYKEGTDTTVDLGLGEGHRIQEVKVVAPAFKSSIWPTFRAMDRGLGLSDYRAEYVAANGVGNTSLEVQITYAPIEGLPLPESLTIRSVYEGNANKVRLLFKNHKAVRASDRTKAPAAK